MSILEDLTPGEISEAISALMKREREKTRSLMIPTAAMLASGLAFIGRPDLQKLAQSIIDALLKGETQ
jgi:hypothetical protein